MSTLSGISAKGEKAKQKYQSLDINSLYRASRGESLESHQHKNTSARRHGMQTLGKVPSTRRPPVNLPSLKSEYSGNDPAVSLVPSGGTGWGSKPGETGPPPSSTQAAATSTTATPAPPSTSATTVTAVVTVTSSHVTPTTSASTSTPVSAPPAPPTVPVPTQSHGHSHSHSDKSWSSITSNNLETAPMFLAHQSPFFQQEFPSLSGDASATSGSGKGDATHLPGPSLRPQTEGSWMQGGNRFQAQMGGVAGGLPGTAPAPGPPAHHHMAEGGGGRSNLGPSGGGVGPAGPIPPPGMPPHHYGLMPQFMMRHNLPAGGFPPNYQHGPPRPRFYPPDTRFMPPNRGSPPNNEPGEMTTRPIIKEEDLKVMDEISKDTGWAAHDEIDYNQTLSFSDEEGAQDDESKSKQSRQLSQTAEKRETENRVPDSQETQGDSNNLKRESSRESMHSSHSESREPPRAWQQPMPLRPDLRQGVPPPMVSFPTQHPRIAAHQSGRQNEEDEVWREKRRIQNEEVALAVERARQRKEEEEKRYEETRQAAARKLQMLEEKMRSKTDSDKEKEEITPPSVVSQHSSNTLLPDWEKDKEKSRSRTNSEEKDEKTPKEYSDSSKNVQADNRGGFGRDRERERERDRDQRPDRDNSGQQFRYQSNLPPRFQKQAAERPPSYYRQGSGGAGQPPSAGNYPAYDMRWPVGQPASHFGGSGGGSMKTSRSRNDSEMSDKDREEIKRIEENRERDRGDAGFENREKDRYSRPPSRDSRERNCDSSWKEHNLGSHNGEHNYDNRQYGKFQESEDFGKEKPKEFKFQDDNKENEKKSNENLKSMQSFHEDTFDERKVVRDNKEENERRDIPQKLDSRDRLERPQRPDSRDSRGSRDSRNSRDSIREDRLLEDSASRETILSWADSTHEIDSKEEKRWKDIKEENESRREPHITYHQRHIPGPITKERLDALELKNESAKSVNLVPLVRSDKKIEVKKTENQWESGSSDVWQRVPTSSAPPASSETDSWVEVSAGAPQPVEHSSDAGQEGVNESQAKNIADDSKTVSKSSYEQRDHAETATRSEREKGMSRGGHRGMRGAPRQGGWNSFYSRGGGPQWRGDRGRRPQVRRHHMARDWSHGQGRGHSESGASEDEVSISTESGKEDKHFPRSPKQGSKKSEKDDRSRDRNRKLDGEKDSYSFGNDNRRYDKRGGYDNSRSSGFFEPRGEPSRRGRGAAFRSKGSSGVGRRMDGYGPPTSKKPFTSDNSSEDKKTDSSSLNQTVRTDNSELSHDDKVKMNQQQLSAGIIGNTARLSSFKSQTSSTPPRMRRKSDSERRDRKPRDCSDRRLRGSIKSGSGSGGEVGDDNHWETTSETSEQEERGHDPSRRHYNQGGSSRGNARRHSQPNRSVGRERRSGNSYDRDSRRSMGPGHQQVLNGNMRSQNRLPKEHTEAKPSEQPADKKQLRPDNKEKKNNLDRIDLSNTASVVVVDDRPELTTVEEDQTVFAPDNNGFQEVRSKKNVKEANRQQKEEPSRGSKERTKPSRPPSSQSPGPPGSNGPNSKAAFERSRATGKLAPRFAKQKELLKTQKMAQQQQTPDVSELNKLNQPPVPVFPVKDLTSPAPPPAVNAWDKPIIGSLRTTTPPSAPVPLISDACNVEVNDHAQSGASSQRSSPNEDKTGGKQRESAEILILDGTSPPVQTIIFENTSYKSAPVDSAVKPKYANQMIKNQRPDKSRERKIEEDSIAVGFKSPGPDLKLQEAKPDTIQMPISFTKNEDNADMKLDFRFDTDLSQLTDEKANKSITAIQMTRSVHMTAQSSTAELQFKLASVKKVWEEPSAVLEVPHSHGGEDNNSVSATASFTPTFGNSMEAGVAVGDSGDDGTAPESYSSSQQLQNNTSSYSGGSVQNMIKPDPSINVCKVKPQPQTAMHPHSGPLSPPSGPFNTAPAQPSQHISYQPAAQYGGISAIPSPPTVPFTPQAELYPTFQINNHQVLSSQGRSQFNQFPSPYLSQTLGQTSGFSQQSLYLHQTAPPPPAAPAAPPHPDMFQTQLNQYRIQPPAYGTSQQLTNNPNTVLISSSTNSLMSATVKPSQQPIGAIGSKAASYQVTSQPPNSQQLYIYPDPQQLLNQTQYLQNSQLVQRPANNVVPTIPPSSASYYSASTGGGATGFYQPGNSSMHQTTFNLQAFSTQSPAATPAGMGSFGSTFLSNGLQMAQQYRSTAPSYLKSAADHQDVLSVFSSPASQINSPKSRAGGGGNGTGGGGKSGPANNPPQQQPSPPASHHKFTAYQQNVSPTTQLMIQHQQQQQQQQRGNVSVRVTPRYPAPIQRPVTFQPAARHRPPPSVRYKIPPPAPPAPTTTAAATQPNHYYVSQNDATKLDNTDLEAKVDGANNDLTSSAPVNPSNVGAESSSATND